MRAVAGIVLLLIGCSEPDFYAFSSNTSGSSDAPEGFTAVAVWVSDSPLDDLETVRVAFERVELVGDRVAVVSAERHVFDLLALRNGREALLAEGEVPAGDYERLRVHLAPTAHEVTMDGTTLPLRLPTSDARIIEVPGPFLLRDGELLELHLDVNLRLSVLEAAGDWFLRPTVRLTDKNLGAFVGGVVRDSAGIALQAVVSAQQDGTEIASTRTEGDGRYRLGPLPASTYTLVVTATGHAPAVVHDIRAPAGAESTGFDFRLQTAETGDLTGSARPGAAGRIARLLQHGALVAVAGIDARGEFTFAAVPPGAYHVEVWGSGGLETDAPAVVGARGTSHVFADD